MKTSKCWCGKKVRWKKFCSDSHRTQFYKELRSPDYYSYRNQIERINKEIDAIDKRIKDLNGKDYILYSDRLLEKTISRLYNLKTLLLVKKQVCHKELHKLRTKLEKKFWKKVGWKKN